jgi:hypothetical protein
VQLGNLINIRGVQPVKIVHLDNSTRIPLPVNVCTVQLAETKNKKGLLSVRTVQEDIFKRGWVNIAAICVPKAFFKASNVQVLVNIVLPGGIQSAGVESLACNARLVRQRMKLIGRMLNARPNNWQPFNQYF